jgi:hypothetical protein
VDFDVGVAGEATACSRCGSAPFVSWVDAAATLPVAGGTKEVGLFR